MLRIKRGPTIVPNYQKEQVDEAARPVGGHERNCLGDCCIQGQWEDRMERGLFRYDVTSCETKVIPGPYGFVAQLNEGRHLKKRPTEFSVDKVLQPFDGNIFNYTKVVLEEALFQFEASRDSEVQFIPDAPIDVGNSPSVVAINVSPNGHVLLIPRVLSACLKGLIMIVSWWLST